MRVLAPILGLSLLASPLPAFAATDIDATCYVACANSTDSTPTLKACLEQAANTADQKLNSSYKDLQSAIRASAKAMNQPPDAQLQAFTAAQKQWIAYRDANCAFEDSLAFGGTATGGNYSACLCSLSYERINDFARIRSQVIGE